MARVSQDKCGQPHSIQYDAWTRKFSNSQRKFADLKISGYVWTGPYRIVSKLSRLSLGFIFFSSPTLNALVNSISQQHQRLGGYLNI